MDVVETIARVAHEMNRTWCVADDDNSQLPWEEAPEWQRESARNGVRFHMENPDASDSASHDNWMAEKLADGWTYGLVKDPEAKTHPCIVPFEELPPSQQFKDHLFRGVVHTMLSKLSEK
jgi:hypothetical protein